MKYSSRLSIRCILLAPLGLVLGVLIALAYDFSQHLDDKVRTEYDRVTKDIAHSVKLLSSLNYSFATYFSHQSDLMLNKRNYKKEIGPDGLCLWLPTEESIQSAYRADAQKVLQIDYAVKGFPEVCQRGTPGYEDILSKLLLAPTFSFLNGIETYIEGLYYVSPLGYMISSPAHLVKDIHEDAIPVINSRQYWTEAQAGESIIRLTGPVADVRTQQPILTISAGLFDQNEFEGLVLLDIMISKLTLAVDSDLDQRISFQSLGSGALPPNAWMPRILKIDGVETDQIMFFEFTWKRALSLFVSKEKTALFGILILYFLTVISLVFLKVREEKRHFHALALHDPLTGLLNRRGFQQFYELQTVQSYEAIATFDIDDFKRINDTYGHDVGDEVIVFVGKLLKDNVRNHDIVARFGGEEYVIYMQSEAPQQMADAIERVCQKIAKSSVDIIKEGFTVSGGMAIQNQQRLLDLDGLIKEADDKLYQAKQSGKNKVVY